MELSALCCLVLLIALMAGCGGCIREADQEPGSARGLFPTSPPTPPPVPGPRAPPTVPALPGDISRRSQTSHSITPSEAVMEDETRG